MNQRKKELLSQTQLSIKDVKEVFDTNMQKARELVHEIRENEKEFYATPIYKKSCVSPIHLLPYLGISKEDYYKYIL